MTTGEVSAGAGALEVRNRLAVAAFGGVALADEGPYPGLDPQHPVGRRDARALGQPFECGPDKCGVTGPSRRLGQLGHDKRPEPQPIEIEYPPRRVAGRVVAAAAVVEHRARVEREVD